MRRALLAVGAGAAALAALRAERSYAAKVAADPRRADLEPTPPVEVRRVRSADGTELHVELHGPVGAPTVVLVHGWTCTTAFWTKQVRALSPDLRVVAFELRGHGRSGGSPASFGPDALAADLQAVLADVLAASEKAVVVGHSMGAMTIAAWAGRHPDEVPRLISHAVLVSTGMDRLSLDSTFVPLPRQLARVQGWLQGRVLGGRGPLLGRSSVLLTRWFTVSRAAGPADVDLCASMMRATDQRSRAAWSREMGRFDLLADLAALTVPVTVVVGTADRLTPPAYSRRLADHLPQLAELVELPGIGHMAPLEAPQELEAIIGNAIHERVTS